MPTPPPRRYADQSSYMYPNLWSERRSDSMTSDSGSRASKFVLHVDTAVDCRLSLRFALGTTDNRRFVRAQDQEDSQQAEEASYLSSQPGATFSPPHGSSPQSAQWSAASSSGARRKGRRREGKSGKAAARMRRFEQGAAGPAANRRPGGAPHHACFCRPLDKPSSFTIAWAGPFSSTSVLPLHLS